jgi:hypothetical protein|mmetsp:Transcript_28550/g.48534  ORF Transcript_28550/g.48534 Transcript_28550/m.48534 type:complete len:114 (+) Transcript_28550:187-528(+)
MKEKTPFENWKTFAASSKTPTTLRIGFGRSVMPCNRMLRTKLSDEEERSERRREEREEWREKYDRILTLIKQGKPPLQRSVKKTHRGRRRSRKYEEERQRASTAPPPKNRSHK